MQRNVLRMLRYPAAFQRRCCRRSASSTSGAPSDEDTIISREYGTIAEACGLRANIASTSTVNGGLTQVVVVQPRIRWGRLAQPASLSVVRLAEAVALVRSLPKMHVVGGVVIGTDYTVARKGVWGSGRLAALRHHIRALGAQAVFLNIEQLLPLQTATLHEELGVAVFDRYQLVLSLFKHHAQTDEARLQIALAEIPYLRRRLRFLDRHPLTHPRQLQVTPGTVNPLRARGPDKYEVVRMREHQLRARLRVAAEKRELAMEGRRPNGASTVAVLGYTNAGKTSIIKSLTADNRLHPKSRLFATVDVSSHVGRMPTSGRRVQLIDTVGFLSELPHRLVASFRSTLGVIRSADLLVHVRDSSHPERRTQEHAVRTTLDAITGIRPELIDNMIVVDNKIDLERKDPIPLLEASSPPSHEFGERRPLLLMAGDEDEEEPVYEDETITPEEVGDDDDEQDEDDPLLRLPPRPRSRVDSYSADNFSSELPPFTFDKEAPRWAKSSSVYRDATVRVSCRRGDGLDELVETIDRAVCAVSGARARRVRVLPDSSLLSAARRLGLIPREPSASDCGRFLVLDLYLTDAEWNQLLAHSRGRLKRTDGGEQQSS